MFKFATAPSSSYQPQLDAILYLTKTNIRNRGRPRNRPDNRLGPGPGLRVRVGPGSAAVWLARDGPGSMQSSEAALSWHWPPGGPYSVARRRASSQAPAARTAAAGSGPGGRWPQPGPDGGPTQRRPVCPNTV